MCLHDYQAPAPPGGRPLLRLLAGLAHTVNNALTGTVGYLELTLRDAPPDGDLAAHARAGLACAHRAAEALRQVIAFATAPAKAHSAVVALRDLAATAASTARVCAGRGVSVHLVGENAALVEGHAAMIAAAVEVVVRNALEAMPENGRLTIETEEWDGRCRLWVRDSGPGIPDEVQDRLFEPFVTTKPFGHLGVGLSLARELAQAQGGSVTLASSVGLGTTVVFSFPAAKEVPGRGEPDRPLCLASGGA
jgi:signal transduction histidine kinase